MQPFGKMGLRAGVLAVTLGIAAFGGSLATASSALAAVPGGNACANDGKVEGSGSTYQTNAQALFWTNYNQDICGNVTSDAIAGQNMGAYNWSSIPSGDTGSGAGLISADCRAADYYGTDLPYTQAEWLDLGGAGGTGAGSTGIFAKNCPGFYTTFAPDLTSDEAGGGLQTGNVLPDNNDTAAQPLSFPVAGSSVAIMINLTAADCTSNVKPSNIELTGAQLSLLEGGTITSWSDSRLRSGSINASLATCNFPVQRVVRVDNSGTTNILKQYLSDATSDGATCTGQPWSAYYGGSTNNVWPSGGTCGAAPVEGTGNGGPLLLAKLQTTNGGIGYADLSDAVTDTTGLIVAKVQNAVGTAYEGPQLGNGAYCTYAGISVPNNGDATAMVGLDQGDNWSNDNFTANGQPLHWDSTNEGSEYPICGLTFDIVYPLASDPTSVSTANADQARTLYTFFRYVESIGQSLLPNNLYAALPDSVTSPILNGIQLNY